MLPGALWRQRYCWVAGKRPSYDWQLRKGCANAERCGWVKSKEQTLQELALFQWAEKASKACVERSARSAVTKEIYRVAKVGLGCLDVVPVPSS